MYKYNFISGWEKHFLPLQGQESFSHPSKRGNEGSPPHTHCIIILRESVYKFRKLRLSYVAQ